MARLPQIGVPVSKQEIKTSFQQIVETKFNMHMADFLRNVVEEVVETYGDLSVAQKVEYNLGNIAIGGPRIMRLVFKEWCRRNPDLAQQLKLDSVSDEGQEASPEHKGKTKRGSKAS
jgi:hypothetical protein